MTYPLIFALVPDPVGGKPWESDLVLTRLHARYGREITNDLVFKKAEPITGGREVLHDGKLEEGARADTSNNFQARYAIRHPWAGAITCANPQRNVWGGPPTRETRPSEPVAATGLAFVQRTGSPLPELVKRDVPEIAVKATAPAAYAVPAPTPPASGSANGSAIGSGNGSASSGSGSAAPRDDKPAAAPIGGCGCDTNGRDNGLAIGGLAGLATLLRRRRRAA